MWPLKYQKRRTCEQKQTGGRSTHNGNDGRKTRAKASEAQKEMSLNRGKSDTKLFMCVARSHYVNDKSGKGNNKMFVYILFQ